MFALHKRSCSLGLLFIVFWSQPVKAQSVTPATDGTGTVINQNGNQIDITGGTLSQDQINLFHSFNQFGLNQNEIANFLSNPNIQNILGRVVGGNASIINGLIQVTGGNSNLFLMNPSGIIFGANAQLNVPASFTATTATGIGFGNNLWFNANGLNNYAALVGDPSQFAFNVNQTGSILNAGSLQVGTGQNLFLIGGNVINTGTLTAPEGNITIAAIPGSSLVKISQPGHLLSLEINPNQTSAPSTITPLSLPQLLTGGNVSQASGVSVDSNGQVVLTSSGVILPETGGVAIASGNINVAGETGGKVNVLGEKVGVIGGNINASGTNGGGTVLIGGDFQGKGTVPNAQTTFVDQNSQINANATTLGNGGKVIVWADKNTNFYGNISAQGGSIGGNGGFVEVSGKEFLNFNGQVNTFGPNGNTGILLLDPTDINIVSGSGSATLTDVSAFTSFNTDGASSNINATLINNATSNVVLQATGSIAFQAPINISQVGIGLTAQANTGGITVNSPITTNGGTIDLQGTSNLVKRGVDITADINSGGGTIRINGINTNLTSDEEGLAISSSINSAGGDIILLGTSSLDDGVLAYGNINSGGGNITINGTAQANNFGIVIDPPNAIVSGGGDINLTGTSPDGDTTPDIGLYGGLLDSGSGNFTINANDPFIYDLSNAKIQGSGILTIQPRTANFDLGIGGTGSFLDSQEINFIQNGFSEILIGRSDGSGAVSFAGNVTFQDPVTLRSPLGSGSINTNGFNITGSDSLTLEAANSISISNSIISPLSDSLNVTLNADRDSNGVGSISINGTTISTNGGDIILGGGSNPLTQPAVGTASGVGQGVYINNSTLNAGTGNISIRGIGGTGGLNAHGILFDGTFSGTSSQVITTGGGTITMTGITGTNATGSAFSPQGILFFSPSTIQSENGDISLDGTSILGGGSNARGITLVSGATIQSTGSGNITLVGNNNPGVGAGIIFQDGNSKIISNSGNIALTGSSSDGTGVALSGLASSGIFSSSGNIVLTGTSNSFTGIGITGLTEVNSNSGDITFIGSSDIGKSIHLYGNGSTNPVVGKGTGTITLIGDEIDLATSSSPILQGTGILQLQPLTPSLDITVGGTIDDTNLNLDTSKLANIQNGFSEIFIGRSDGSGAITLANNITFNDPVTLRSPVGSGTINTQGFDITGTDNATITLLASQGITANNITTNAADITLTSAGGNITTNVLNSRSSSSSGNAANGGNITVTTAEGNISAGDMQSSSVSNSGSTANGGNIALTTTEGNISTGFLNSYSSSNSGNVGNAGNISLSTTGGNITTENLYSYSYSIAAGNAGNGGNIALTSTGGSISTKDLSSASVSNSGNAENGGNIKLSTTVGNITTGNIESNSYSITAGNTKDAGDITLTTTQGNISTENLQSTSVSNSGNTENGGNIKLFTTVGNITTGKVGSYSYSVASGNAGNGGEITLEAINGSIFTKNLNSSSPAGGGDIIILAQNQIITGQIDSSSSIGDGGNVRIDPITTIVESINAQGGTNGIGGQVNITAFDTFRAVGTFVDRNGILASISTAGGLGGGDITIYHPGVSPFTVGNADIHGTAGAITSGANNSIIPKLSFLSSYTQENIRLVPLQPGPPEPPEPIMDIIDDFINDDQILITDDVFSDDFSRQTISNELNEGNIEGAVASIEESISGEYKGYYGEELQLDAQPQTVETIQAALRNIAQQTGKRSAITYIILQPESLELVIITPDGKPVHRSVKVNKNKLIADIKLFRNNVTDISSSGYQQSGKNLYNYLIAPIQAALTTEKIDTLLFSVDNNLRSLPFAALYDGKNYLVENYNIGLIPSVTLMDTRYQSLKNSQILLMGASKFINPNQNSLPGVMVELPTVAKEFGENRYFINQEFTIDNLQKQRQKRPTQIVHLATHGEFNPGDASKSYIQFWGNEKLQLDQIRTLGFRNPPVELLVLSACRTALGNEQVELGFAGLAVQAGVKSAVASLWYVSDEGTLGLMNEFYQKLKTAPIKSEALRQSQIAMIEGKVTIKNGEIRGTRGGISLPPELTRIKNRNLSHPYYWAAFTMIGSPW
jgi:filamentous hemagglutinin family protein